MVHLQDTTLLLGNLERTLTMRRPLCTTTMPYDPDMSWFMARTLSNGGLDTGSSSITYHAEHVIYS